MRVIFVNRFYWPETPATGQLLSDLAEGLARQGWEVTVITSAPRGLASTETHAGVSIRRIPSADRTATTSLVAKARDFLRFHLGAATELWRRAGRDTIVVALTDPPLLGVTCALIARLRHAALVHWVHDIYPELAITLAAQQWARVLLPARNAAWRAADGCTALGYDMAERIRAAGVLPNALQVIPNWAPRGVAPVAEESIRARRLAWGLDDFCVVMYAGNLGRVHDLDPLLEVATHTSEDSRLCFVFVGGGPRQADLQAAAAKRGLRNVRFLPAQPREELAVVLGVGDIHVVTLLPSCATLVFPSKLYGAAAAGRPIMFLGPVDSEPARVVRAAGCGVTLATDDPKGVAEQLRQLAEDAPRRAVLGEAALRFAAATAVGRGVTAWHHQLERIRHRHAGGESR